MTKEELKQLSDEELFKYFCKNTRFVEGIDGYEYKIMTEDGILVDADTYDLRQKFENWVKG